MKKHKGTCFEQTETPLYPLGACGAVCLFVSFLLFVASNNDVCDMGFIRNRR